MSLLDKSLQEKKRTHKSKKKTRVWKVVMKKCTKCILGGKTKTTKFKLGFSGTLEFVLPFSKNKNKEHSYVLHATQRFSFKLYKTQALAVHR